MFPKQKMPGHCPRLHKQGAFIVVCNIHGGKWIMGWRKWNYRMCGNVINELACGYEYIVHACMCAVRFSCMYMMIEDGTILNKFAGFGHPPCGYLGPFFEDFQRCFSWVVDRCRGKPRMQFYVCTHYPTETLEVYSYSPLMICIHMGKEWEARAGTWF